MADIGVLEQLVNSIEEALKKLEAARQTSDVNYINRLRVFIFNAYQKIDHVLGGKNVR